MTLTFKKHKAMRPKPNPEFEFQMPAVYKIRVQGAISASDSERLGGLQLNKETARDKSIVSVLVGQINDQAALAGILNTLHESHLTILSVTRMKE